MNRPMTFTASQEIKQPPMLPLSGVRVLEFCQVAAGPFSGMLLADMGADVVKIEAPAGDGMRNWPPITTGYSENFASLNRNKRSIVLDLKNPDDVQSALALSRSADVVIENFRPGVMDRLGLGYAALKERNPRLVYCSISAFGQEGPRSQEGGFDVTLQAIAGVMSVTGMPDGLPVKSGVPISDFAAGLYAAYTIVCALRHAASQGVGSHIDIPMMGATLGIAALQTSEYFGTGNDPRRLGAAHPRNAPYEAFACKDGHFVLAAGNNDLYVRTCQAIGRMELAADERFETSALRAQNQAALKALLEQTFVTMTADECLDRLRAKGVPCAPINTYSQALSDPQVAHYEWIQPLDLPGGTTTRTVVAPFRMSGASFGVYRRPPALGEHNAEVLSELAAEAPLQSPDLVTK